MKLMSWLLSEYRFRKLLKPLKGRESDLTGRSLKNNAGRRHDHLLDQVNENPNEGIIKLDSPHPTVLCMSAANVRHMLKNDFDVVTKPSNTGWPNMVFGMLKEFIGEGIFILRHGETVPRENAAWYSERKTAACFFTKNNAKNLMEGTFVEKGLEMIHSLEPIARSNSINGTNDIQKGAQPVDFQEKFFSYTFDSIEKLFFGFDSKSCNDKMSHYASSYDGAQVSMMRYFLKGIALNIVCGRLLPYPFGYWNERSTNCLVMYFHQKYSDDYANFKKCVEYLHDETDKRVSAMRQRSLDEYGNTLINGFLMHDNTVATKRLSETVLNFIIAGRDTTACLLTWLFFELSINQDVQNRLFEEIERVIGKSLPTMEHLSVSNMPYLNGCIMEALRMHPPVPTDAKVAAADIVFPDGAKIPKDTRLIFSPYCMGRDSKKYPNPLEFYPNRWIPFKEPDMFEFPVFQAGPRFCLGKDMAKFEAKILTCMLMSRFSFELEKSECPSNFTYSSMITMSLCNALDQSSAFLWLVPKTRF